MNLRKVIAAAVLGAGLSIAAAAPALASITPGAFCKDSQDGAYGNSKDGDTYICVQRDGDIRHRWRAVVTAEPTPSTTTEPTPGTSEEPSDDVADDPQLPTTGPGNGLIAAITAGTLITTGAGAILLTRRHRRRFVA